MCRDMQQMRRETSRNCCNIASFKRTESCGHISMNTHRIDETCCYVARRNFVSAWVFSRSKVTFER